MNRAGLPDAAFVAPDGHNLEEVRAFAQGVLDLVLAHAASAGTRSPSPSAALPVVAADLPGEPRPEDALLGDLAALLRGSMNPGHPGYVGHMDTLPAVASVLGELASASVNNNMLSVEMSPALSRLEGDLTGSLARLFGLGEAAGGVLTSGGSLANLQALGVARNVAFGALEHGVWGLGRPPVILASRDAHTSLHKAATLLGLGTAAVRPVDTDGHGRLSVASLREALDGARRAGHLPFCVVGTAGTTVTGAIDPLPELGALAREEGLWFHVDAAYGGAVVVSDEHRARLRGVELADSVTFNPQKWWYVAKTCATVLFRDFGRVAGAFRVGAPYMRGATDLNLGEVSVQGTRHAEALKLWLTLQHLGRPGLAHLVDEGYRLAGRVLAQVLVRPGLELASPGDTNVVCFRAAPPGLGADEHDGLNAALQAALLDDGIFVSLPLYRGRRWLRLVPLNPFTGEQVVDRLFARLDELVRSAVGRGALHPGATSTAR